MRDAILAFSDDTEAKLDEKVTYCEQQSKNYAQQYVLKDDPEDKARSVEHHVRSVVYRDAIEILRGARQRALIELSKRVSS